MSWKEQIRQCYREAIGTGDLYAEQEAIIEVVEALLKETEQRVSQDFLMQCFEADNGNHIISTCELEQLREKYNKGVE